MNQHRYLRAYMAGIVVPTLVLLLLLIGLCIVRFVCRVPAPIERFMIFPMAVIPSVFGVWNMLYVKMQPTWHTPIGLHGAVLPLLIGPAGFVIALALDFLKITPNGLVYFDVIHIPYWFLGVAPFFGIAAYYLVWKYIVGYCNQVLGIAG
jgi:hypothetical protein